MLLWPLLNPATNPAAPPDPTDIVSNATTTTLHTGCDFTSAATTTSSARTTYPATLTTTTTAENPRQSCHSSNT